MAKPLLVLVEGSPRSCELKPLEEEQEVQFPEQEGAVRFRAVDAAEAINWVYSVLNDCENDWGDY